MTTRLAALAALWLCAAGVRPAPALSEAEIMDLYTQGKQVFREANDLAARDPDAARELYRKAALRFERIVREGGVENGRLYYNIGNAYFRMNDLGRAILNYRRAELYVPNDSNLQQNLRYARARRLDRVEEAQRTRVLKTLFFWHYDLSTRTRAILFAAFFLGLWALAAAHLFARRAFLRWGIGTCAAVALSCLGSLTAEAASRQLSREGVVVAPEVVARKGDSESFDPSFTEPLHAGTEFRLAEEREAWIHVELVDGRRCWLPAKAVERVR